MGNAESANIEEMIELPVLGAAPSGVDKPRNRFWRSISELQDDPAFEDFVRDEFLAGASDTPSSTSRRQFLQLMGASMALAGLTACRKPVEAILPYARRPEEVIPGIPLNFATGMPFRGVLQGLLVESHEGRPTKVEGNPEHPVSIGASGLFEQASILDLYDPDRSRFVLRDGSRSSWNDFADFVRTYSGRRIAVLSEESSSPTLRAARASLAARYPGLKWVTYRTGGSVSESDGIVRAFGSRLRPWYRFSRAKVIVSFDGDFLSPVDRNFVSNTREYAASRKVDDASEAMSRLYVVESTFSITGGMADNRLALRSSDIGPFAAAVAAKLGLISTAGGKFAEHPYVAAIADDLREAGSAAVVLAGETQPATVHALCAAINSYLGATGQTVELLDTQPVDDTSTLPALVRDMKAGNVDALVLLGVNPVYDVPAELDFAAAMKGVRETIHLGHHVDETARIARWHIPRSHYLEAWGDGRAFDGTLSVIQPLIAPLYESRSDIELVTLLATGEQVPGYDLVREQWRGFVRGDFEKGWRKVLHDGFLPGTAFAKTTPAARPVVALPEPLVSEGDIEIVFRLDPTVLDGRFANNAWLQELPDPATKIVWDNVAVMSPATAERLGVRWTLSAGKYHVDVVEIESGGITTRLPIWVLPGHADDSISVTFGYGREISSSRPERKAIFFDLDHYTDVYGHGAISTGVGGNVGPLRSASFAWVAAPGSVNKVDDGYLIASTQDHGALPIDRRQVERRAPFQMATLEQYRANPTFARDYTPGITEEAWEDYPALWQESHPSDQPAYKDNDYYEYQWGMVIDLNSCTGCNACIVACQSENNVQVVGKEEVSRGREMHWIRLDRYFVGEPSGTDGLSMVLQPIPCMHCENAPCESVCPVAATVHSPDGTNQMIYNRCIGTRYCANNCPYKVRRFNFYNWVKTLPTSVHMAQNPNVTVRSRGVMEKCSYCVQRIREVNQQVNLEGRSIRDGEVKTACQQVCPASAITFGNIADPNSAVSRQRSSDRRYEMLAQLSVKPRTSYLGRVVNPNPALARQS